MTPIEDILDQALALRASGRTPAEILAQFPDQAHELEPLLSVAEAGLAIAKLTVPRPAKRRKFALEKVPAFGYSLFAAFRVAIIPIVLLLAVLGGEAVAQAQPGNSLGYKLRVAAEQAQIKLTSNENQRARLQTALAQKRLQEAQNVLTQTNNPEARQAAFTELSKQTQAAVQTAAPLVAAQALAKDTKPLEDLLALNKQVVQLANKAGADSSSSSLAAAAQTTKQQLATLVATVNDLALAQLVKQSDLTVKGPLKIDSNNSITIKGVAFAVNAETVVKSDADTANLALKDLQPNSEVTVSGVKGKNGELVATAIAVTAAAPESETKTSAPTHIDEPSKPASSIKKAPTAADAASDATTDSRASASFIVEPATSQYNAGR